MEAGLTESRLAFGGIGGIVGLRTYSDGGDVLTRKTSARDMRLLSRHSR